MEQKAPSEENRPVDDKCPAGKEHDLKVEIRQYQTLLEILDEPKKVLKVISAIVVLALAIFMALAFTTIAIKRFYPYNEIKTNMFGATTMQNEEVELTYWLFNTADLWANSGIRVERGDKLTIRASGKSNTSIHHLVENALYNHRPRYRWVGTEGEPRPANMRTAYRIYAERDPDALIMQVVPEQGYNNKKLREEYLRPDFVPAIKGEEDPQNRFYHIGKERTDLLINQSGRLHFAVNDIVLTDRCIDSLVRKNDSEFKEIYPDDYLDLLLLKHDTVMLERLLRKRYRATWTDSAALAVVVWKKFGSREDVELRPVKICPKGEWLAQYTDTSRLWNDGAEIISLRKQCDTLREFYRYIREHRRYDKDDPAYARIDKYLVKRPFKDKLGREAVGSAEKLFADLDLLQSFADSCSKAYQKNLDRLNVCVTRVETLSEKWRKVNRHGLYFGAHPVALLSDIDDKIDGKFWHDLSDKDFQAQIYPFYNEMTYYRETHYYDAWYEDNVGSFLIVVERHKNSDL